MPYKHEVAGSNPAETIEIQVYEKYICILNVNKGIHDHYTNTDLVHISRNPYIYNDSIIIMLLIILLKNHKQ